ncbi:hypothetical protein IFM12275_66780 [Nocardia sputorum]|nr:hypothetical protein IFM12275_66780 [Nocardia sputorum]
MLASVVDPVHVVAQRHVHQRERKDQRGHEDDPRGCRAHSEPLGKKQRRDQIDRCADGENQTDQIRGHNFSTPRWINPSSANAATVSAVNTTTDITRPTSIRAPGFGATERVKRAYGASRRFLTTS